MKREASSEVRIGQQVVSGKKENEAKLLFCFVLMMRHHIQMRPVARFMANDASGTKQYEVTFRICPSFVDSLACRTLMPQVPGEAGYQLQYRIPSLWKEQSKVVDFLFRHKFRT
ncbi:hypothetical protein M5K25_021286 [Dendrobium thyrsiflorum]|uniref:Uncharacterized protein n=1 Tax=Dendrobium thyrsiflorum TaxID=117978 RepID=A0ABD0UJ12_DENTH